MKLILFVFVWMSFSLNSQGQSLSPFVISSSGAFFSGSNGMLSSTTGEMSMVKTFSSGGNILTQGFQQAFDFVNSIPNHSPVSDFIIYPNPSSGQFSILLPSFLSGEIVITVYDAIGKKVYDDRTNVALTSNFLGVSLQDVNSGMYILEVKGKGNHYIKKINLIK